MGDVGCDISWYDIPLIIKKPIKILPTRGAPRELRIVIEKDDGLLYIPVYREVRTPYISPGGVNCAI